MYQRLGGYHAGNHSPAASGKQPARKRNPVALINLSLDTLRARRYIATGGDQIELRPPNMPENSPTSDLPANMAAYRQDNAKKQINRKRYHSRPDRGCQQTVWIVVDK